MATERDVREALEGRHTLCARVNSDKVLAFAYRMPGEEAWLHIERFEGGGAVRAEGRFDSVPPWRARLLRIASLEEWETLPPVDEMRPEDGIPERGAA